MQVTTWSLEMGSPEELRPAPKPSAFEDLALVQARRPSAAFARFLYATVGGDWQWIDRLPWSESEWLAWLDRPRVETWVAYVEGTPAGYFQLDGATDPESVEIAYFGLMPGFIGQGLGGWLLTEAIRRAWALGTGRVWVHTCSLDGPHALANYQARGLRVFKEEVS